MRHAALVVLSSLIVLPHCGEKDAAPAPEPVSLSDDRVVPAPPTRADLLDALRELRVWDEARPEVRIQAMSLVGDEVSGVTFLRPAEFSCGGAAHEVGIYVHDATGLELALVPGGLFQMGSPAGEAGRAPDERARAVTLSQPFLVARTEVPTHLWEKVMGGGRAGPAAGMKRERRTRDAEADAAELTEDDLLPVAEVTWSGAREFCDRVGLDLPTEAQWEFACRAGTRGRFSFGDGDAAAPAFAWLAGNAGASPNAVATRKPNALGLFDMHGNVFEWCADAYGPYPAAVTDPAGPAEGDGRVCRGGSWYAGPDVARSAARASHHEDTKTPDLGFRPVLPVTLRR